MKRNAALTPFPTYDGSHAWRARIGAVSNNQQSRMGRLKYLAMALAWLCVAYGDANAQTFPLRDGNALVPLNVKAEPVEYKGRKAIRLTKTTGKNGFAVLSGTDFQDGAIEADIALKVTTPPGIRMPGFVGIAFRARQDASRYELFYLRPGNSQSDDQAMRNHSVQYTSEPEHDWYKLRRQWPWVYESHADLQLETWTKVKIEVKGRSAKLYLNGSNTPSLIVDGLMGEDLRGGVVLWCDQGEEAYFSNVRVTNATPASLRNGGEAAGTWKVAIASDYGSFKGNLSLKRDGNHLTGSWSGDFGESRPVTGTWRNGYVELSFEAEWPTGGTGKFAIALASFEGWIDEDAAGGRMRVEDRTDGRWTATRQ